MLILFDIDGTLLRSERAGISAMTSAMAELHSGLQVNWEAVPVSGRLDHLIWNDLVRLHGLPAGAAEEARFRSVYAAHLERRLREHPTAHSLPGVSRLVEHLASHPDYTTGVLTGNWQVTGTMKIRAAGLKTEHFKVAAWAEDGASRRHLPPVAMARLQAVRGQPVDPRQVVIIGDTPQDVDCALHNGCLCIGVGTGHYEPSVLQEAGAHLALPSLAETDGILEWLERARAGGAVGGAARDVR